MSQDDRSTRCNMLSELGRAALERYERRMAEIAKKERELIELERIRQALFDALKMSEPAPSDGEAGLARADCAGPTQQLIGLPNKIMVADRCITLLRQVIEKTRTLADLERRDGAPGGER